MSARRAVVLGLTVLAVAGCSSSGTAPPPQRTPSTAPATTTAQPSTTAPAAPTSVARASTPVPLPSTASTTRAAPFTVSAAARRAGLVDVRAVVPDAVVDLRYATSENFTHVRLYPTSARCLVHTSMRSGLLIAADRLRAQGFRLVFWDCYRPHTVQIRMFRLVPDPEFVARPGPYARSHEAGRSVDVTLSRAGRPVGMGTGFDSFTSRAHAYATDGVSAAARAHRAILRRAMAASGLTVYTGEWWHFDGPGAGVPRPVLGAPLH